MKFSDLTEEQKKKIADKNPEWIADNCPEWMAVNRPHWMADHLIKETIDEGLRTH
jgi:hypothetical protein